MELEVLKLFFPEELVAHFDITGSAIKQGKHGDYLEVEFTERNELPEGYSSEEYEAKDFVEKTIQDFPIRSHAAQKANGKWKKKRISMSISSQNNFVDAADCQTLSKQMYMYPKTRFRSSFTRYAATYDNSVSHRAKKNYSVVGIYDYNNYQRTKILNW